MRISFTLLLLVLLLPGMLEAEEVSLSQALREAAAARPMSLAASAEAEAAEEAVGEARSLYLPRLRLSENLLWTDEPGASLFISLNQEDLAISQDSGRFNFPPSRKDFETRLQLEQPLYDPDIAFGLRRAEKGSAAARAAARRSADEAAFAAFAAYIEVQRAEAALSWVVSARDEAGEILRLARERKEAGIGLKADALRAEVEVSIAERRMLAAGNDLTLARRSLALALGREEGEVGIAEPLTPALFEAPEQDRFLLRGDLAALSLRTEEAELARRQSRAAYLPRASLKASYALHDEVPFGTEAGSWSLWAGVSWELFDGFGRAHEEARSAAAKRAVEARRKEGVRQARFALEEARLRAEEARLALASAQAAMAAAEEGRRLLLQRYQAGLADLSDMLSAQSASERSRFEAIEAESRLILSLGNIRFQNGAFIPAILNGKEITE